MTAGPLFKHASDPLLWAGHPSRGRCVNDSCSLYIYISHTSHICTAVPSPCSWFVLDKPRPAFGGMGICSEKLRYNNAFWDTQARAGTSRYVYSIALISFPWASQLFFSLVSSYCTDIFLLLPYHYIIIDYYIKAHGRRLRCLVRFCALVPHSLGRC